MPGDQDLRRFQQYGVVSRLGSYGSLLSPFDPFFLPGNPRFFRPLAWLCPESCGCKSLLGGHSVLISCAPMLPSLSFPIQVAMLDCMAARFMCAYITQPSLGFDVTLANSSFYIT